MLRFRLGWAREGRVQTPSDKDDLHEDARKKLKIHFWVPAETPGARIAVFNMLGSLREEVGCEELPWEITCSPNLPKQATDVLVSYKAVPPAEPLPGQPVRVLLFCDQLECLWGELKQFAGVVVHSSLPLARLVASRHTRVWFIEECEHPAEIAAGQERLAQSPPSGRPPVLAWHGHRHTLEGLLALRPLLENFAREREVRLRLISNHPAGNEQWGTPPVERVAYDDEAFAALAGEARLGLTPTRNHRMKHCLFKPSSRLRRLYALGVPAIGESRCPMVREFAGELPTPHPCANSPAEWARLLHHYWDHPEALDALARAGHEHVLKNYAMSRYARQWIQFLAQIFSFKT